MELHRCERKRTKNWNIDRLTWQIVNTYLGFLTARALLLSREKAQGILQFALLFETPSAVQSHCLIGCGKKCPTTLEGNSFIVFAFHSSGVKLKCKKLCDCQLTYFHLQPHLWQFNWASENCFNYATRTPSHKYMCKPIFLLWLVTWRPVFIMKKKNRVNKTRKSQWSNFGLTYFDIF